MNVRRIIFTVLGVVLLCGFAVFHLAYSVVGEKRDFAEQARQWAETRTSIREIEDIYEYRGTINCAVVTGKNQQGIRGIAWMTEDWIFYETLDGKVTRESVEKAVAQAFPSQELIHIVPGIENRKPFWEALVKHPNGAYQYIYYDFYNGSVIKSFTIKGPAKV